MKRWTGLVAVVLSSLTLMACGGVAEDVDAPLLAQQEAGIDVCGNGLCFRTEQLSCPEDCYYGGYCGDGYCSGPEDSFNCSSDCRSGGGCVAPTQEPRRDDGPVQGIDVCGNGICFRTEQSGCPEDCYYGGYCGDGYCSGPEDSSSCSSDCRSGC